MHKIPGYRIHETIARRADVVIHRAFRVAGNARVIIKTPVSEDASFEHEYGILKALDVRGVVRPVGFENFRETSCLLLEDPGGRLLTNRIESDGETVGNLPFFFDLAVSLTRTVGDLHRKHIIHKGISSSGILVDTSDGAPTFIDFGMASFFPGEDDIFHDPPIPRSWLPYISPEQTGRLNRTVDYRTDFYSLGIVFYEVLTGTQPFTDANPQDIIHGHLARRLVPPFEIVSVPKAISDVVVKLLAKAPEERYQSAEGLISDLEFCQKFFEAGATVGDFVPGRNDYSALLTISEKIYGREQETETLDHAFEEACLGRAGMVFVSGPAGIGKTSLVLESCGPVSGKRGFFISGKCDEFHHNVPYSPLISAFQDLIRQLLTESEANLEYWKKRLENTLGEQARIIIDTIPEAELVTGPRPPAKALPPAEARNRFRRVFLDFIGVFCEKDHPLVLFLDDLQWADFATLEIMGAAAADPSVNYFLFIGSYRDDQVLTGPLSEMIDPPDKENGRSPIVTVRLRGMGPEHVARLIADSINTDESTVMTLADIVARKTGGNSFFVVQFLRTLCRENLLFFDRDGKRWRWDPDLIRDLAVTENVIDLLVERLGHMPPRTRESLHLAACVGNRFDAEILAELTGDTVEDIAECLLPAIREDLIARVRDDAPGEKWGVFIFRHDRIRQAAYEIEDKDRRKAVHLRIGRSLLERGKSEEIFDTLDHLNFAEDLVRSDSERFVLAGLNLAAGRVARRSAAFEPAYNYLTAGVRFISEKGWEHRYELALDLYSECIDTACLCGRFPEMDELFEILCRNARAPEDLADAYKAGIQAHMARHRPPAALSAALEILSLLGEEINGNPARKDAAEELERTMSEIAQKGIEQILRLPEMVDPSKLAAMRILSTIISAAYIAAPNLFPMAVCRMANLSVQYGCAKESAVGFGGLGVVLCGPVGDIETGYKLGQLAMNLIERFDVGELKARIWHGIANYINGWKTHFRETLDISLEGHRAGVETGDYEFAAYNIFTYNARSFLVGKPLDIVAEEMATYGDEISRLRQQTAAGFNNIFRQTVANLLWENDDPASLSGDFYDERAMLPIHRQASDLLAIFFFHFCTCMLACLFGDCRRAVEYADLAGDYVARVPGHSVVAVFHFYSSLARLAAIENDRTAEKEAILETVRSNQKQMKKWAEHAPGNYLHKYHLTEAELSRATGDDKSAMAHYDRAIALARGNEYLNEEALATELAAKFWLSHGNDEFAAIFMQRAVGLYDRWGTRSKAGQLRRKYGGLLKNEVPETENRDRPVQSPESPGGYRMDLDTLVKAAQAISGEIVLDRLMATLMRIVMANAGAEKGFLILNSDRGLVISAKGGQDERKVFDKPRLLSEAERDLSSTVAIFVFRTKKPLVLNGAQTEGLFVNDPHIASARPKSTLCVPLLYKSEPIGVLYLENRLVSGVFTADRLGTIKFLASQIAISIENARLYDDLKKAEEKYRGIFENAVEGIFQTASDGQIISANPAMARILGYDSPEDLIAHITNVGEQSYVSPTERDECLRLMRETTPISGHEVQLYKKDGSKIWASLHARSVFDENGALILTEGLLEDVTERKKATDILKEREERLRKENIRLRSDLKDRYKFGKIIGKSEAMREVYELIVKAGGSEANVILYGESGTGKELVARAIHDMSERANRNFVPVNCGAIPENLIESEFFGYRKGAFTGANLDKQGYLDLADGGTLFLDELGEMNLNLQVKLLRILEGGGYTPVGGTELKKPDVRIIAATNRNLGALVIQGKMRKDFFYRIHIIPVFLPPLRKRREDIPLLIEHFTEIFGKGKTMPSFSGKMLETILNYAWPGNVRELQNVMHRYFTLNRFDLAQKESGEPEPLESDAVSDQTFAESYAEAMEGFERKLVTAALEKHRWHRERAAESLGIPRRTFFRRLSRLGIVVRNPSRV